MRLIDADALERHVYTEWVNGELSNSEWVDFRQWLKDEPTVEPASPWHRVDEKPPPEGKRVVVYDGDSIRFMKRVENIDCGISIPYWENDDGSWERLHSRDYWMPIEPPKEDA